MIQFWYHIVNLYEIERIISETDIFYEVNGRRSEFPIKI